jgi:hypothetical protein
MPTVCYMCLAAACVYTRPHIEQECTRMCCNHPFQTARAQQHVQVDMRALNMTPPIVEMGTFGGLLTNCINVNEDIG